MKRFKFTSEEFFNAHAPDFNFEKSELELVGAGISSGFIKYAENDLYFYSSLEMGEFEVRINNMRGEV